MLVYGLKQIKKKKKTNSHNKINLSTTLRFNRMSNKEKNLPENKAGCLWGEYLKIYGKVIVGKIR